MCIVLVQALIFEGVGYVNYYYFNPEWAAIPIPGASPMADRGWLSRGMAGLILALLCPGRACCKNRGSNLAS